MDLDDLVVQRSMAQQGEIAKYRQVNEQVTDVGAATINTDAVEFVRAKEGQEQVRRALQFTLYSSLHTLLMCAADWRIYQLAE